MPEDDFSPRLGLPYLLPNQAQKHVTLNESLRWLDSLTMAVVNGIGTEMPPPDPVAGIAFITGPNPSDAWAHLPCSFVVFLDGGWHAKVPVPGWRVWDLSSAQLRVFDGQDWLALTSGPQPAGRFETIGIATMADAEVAFQARLNAALFTARDIADDGTGDLRISLNKASAGNTASLVFQSGWTGHAEMALGAGNRFGVRLSEDGTTWFDGLALDPSGRTVETPLDLVPAEDATQDLGRPDRSFRDLYLATSPQVQSDARLKTDIAPLDSAAQLIAALRPVQFRRGRQAELHFGFLAQDVKAALDACGQGCAALWRLSDPTEPNSTQLIRPSELIAVLVAAVQALGNRIDKLEGAQDAASDD